MIAAAAPLRGHPSDLRQQSPGHEVLLPYQTLTGDSERPRLPLSPANLDFYRIDRTALGYVR
jgi:hypothetical protein